ncbi:MAG: 16S rRNA (cytidine(1402)-2'-O)-methyltransferase [Ignavibacteriales bacterium CG07_land_8_20_14_0_80_59_12]|nr:MAG: 16S rRNA (cytidine(1402)-2'-O)-methyltransferase [Ignavibacteriales bacterium CG07_land_8_20_14_0_80_59_12]
MNQAASESTTQVVHGALYVVSTPIGNLSDFTFRAVEILSAVDIIAAEDTRTTRVLLDRYHISTPAVSYFARSEKSRSPELIKQLKEGKSIALVSDAGTPTISDPGAVLVRAAIEAGCPVIPIPGPAAFTAALAVSGLQTDRFVFEGFLPVKKGRRTKLVQLAAEPRTIVLYESSHRLLRTLRETLDAFGNRHAAVSREITKKFEETVRGNLFDLLVHFQTAGVRGEFVIVIEGAARARKYPAGTAGSGEEDKSE